MEYEIVATLGPASGEESTWRAMLDAGATAFRLNTSHLSLSQLDEWLDRLGSFLTPRTQPRWVSARPAPLGPRPSPYPTTPSLILDLQGSKWRLGDLPAHYLSNGETVELVLAATSNDARVLPVPHADFFYAASLSNGEIVLNDGRVRLSITGLADESIQARVMQGGPLSAHKGITFAQSTFRKEALGEKDQAIVERTRSSGVAGYALSYVRDAQEMARYRAYFGREPYLIAKLEREPALAEAKRIEDSADELWLCRGDLGAELGERAMANSVHRFSSRLAEFERPVLLAGQVLEHMTEHTTPTRSEVCYLFDTLQRGYCGVVLSDETAIGRDPVAACRAAALFTTD